MRVKKKEERFDPFIECGLGVISWGFCGFTVRISSKTWPTDSRRMAGRILVTCTWTSMTAGPQKRETTRDSCRLTLKGRRTVCTEGPENTRMHDKHTSAALIYILLCCKSINVETSWLVWLSYDVHVTDKWVAEQEGTVLLYLAAGCARVLHVTLTVRWVCMRESSFTLFFYILQISWRHP